jgi:hypothetical protein
MMASMDAINIHYCIAAEIKCASAEDHGTAAAGELPEKYFPQLQHQLEVCGLDEMYYFSFHNQEGILLTVPRNEKYIKILIEEEEKFLECMQKFEAPLLMDKDYLYIGDPRWAHLPERLKALKILQEEEKKIREELIHLADGQNCMGAGIKVAKLKRKGAVDYSKVPELQGINLEPYRKEMTDYWRIS